MPPIPEGKFLGGSKQKSPGTPTVPAQLVQEEARGQPGRHPNMPKGRRRQISKLAEGGGRRVRSPLPAFWSSVHHQAAKAGS